MFATHTYPKVVLGSSGSHLYPRKVRTSTFVRQIGFHGGLGINIVGPRYQALFQFPLFSSQASPWDLPPGTKSLQELLS